jgi:hypothetical protein
MEARVIRVSTKQEIYLSQSTQRAQRRRKTHALRAGDCLNESWSGQVYIEREIQQNAGAICARRAIVFCFRSTQPEAKKVQPLRSLRALATVGSGREISNYSMPRHLVQP